MLEKIINYKDIILGEHKTIQEAIILLQKKALQILLIKNKNNEYIGTVTDGDIRRSLLKKNTLNNKIVTAVNKKSIYVERTVPKVFVLELMKKHSINLIPIISKKKILGLYKKKNEFENYKKHNEKVIIMAGGRGTRLLPLTKKIPKAMISIRGKPILEHTILSIVKYNFNNIIISVNHLASHIKSFFGNGYEKIARISYISEKKPLGTVGSLSLVKIKKNENLILMNCDIYSGINLNDLLIYHKKNNADVTIAAKVDERISDYGIIKSSGKKFKYFEEKMAYFDLINTGIYVIKGSCIKYLKKNKKTDIPEFFSLLKNKEKNILIYPIYEYWYDIGQKKNYYKAKRHKVD